MDFCKFVEDVYVEIPHVHVSKCWAQLKSLTSLSHFTCSVFPFPKSDFLVRLSVYTVFHHRPSKGLNVNLHRLSLDASTPRFIQKGWWPLCQDSGWQWHCSVPSPTGQPSIQNRSPDHSYIFSLLISGWYDNRAFAVEGWTLLNSMLIFLIFGNTFVNWHLMGLSLLHMPFSGAEIFLESLRGRIIASCVNAKQMHTWGHFCHQMQCSFLTVSQDNLHSKSTSSHCIFRLIKLIDIFTLLELCLLSDVVSRLWAQYSRRYCKISS